VIGCRRQREFITDGDIKVEPEEVGQRKNATLSWEGRWIFQIRHFDALGESFLLD
jgi:hypothetical protein